MSEKIAKIDRKRIKKELHERILAAEAAQIKKLEAGRDQLITDLRMTAEKMRTVNGFMHAMTILDDVTFDRFSKMSWDDMAEKAKELAEHGAAMATHMANLVADADVLLVDDTIVDNIATEDFISKGFEFTDVARELMSTFVIQNAYGPLRDLIEARTRMNAEITDMEAEAAK